MKRNSNNKNKQLPPPQQSFTSRGGGADGLLFKRGNIGLARCLIAVNAAGPEGISTYRLLYQLGSTHHAKAFIKRAHREGLITRQQGEAARKGQFKPTYNVITDKGRQLLQSQMMGTTETTKV